MTRSWMGGIRTVVCVLGTVFALLALTGGEAQAQVPASGDGLDKLEVVCRRDANNEFCVAMKKSCFSTDYQRLDKDIQRFCRNLKWTREQATKKTINKFKEHCDANDSDEECNTLRKSCREETLTCELAQQLACQNPGSASCDRSYMCTEQTLRSMCAGKSTEGVNHLMFHANYSSIDEVPVDAPEYQDSIYSVSALAHGQTGNESFGVLQAWVVDMGVGWLRGEDNNGLAYDMQILLGPGLRNDDNFMLGATFGGGFSGIISGDLGFGWLFSSELFAATKLPGGLDLLGYLRPSWVFSEDARQDGSQTLGFADELELGGTLTWASKRKEGNFVHGSGYGLTVFMQEQLGVRMLGVGIGTVSVDASQQR